jgi:hypothetical protein
MKLALEFLKDTATFCLMLLATGSTIGLTL